jgi:gliding motility-associated-like protein
MYSDQETLTIDRLEPISVDSTKTAPCEGRYFLTIQQKAPPISVAYSWFYKSATSESVTELSNTAKILDINKAGYYWAMAAYGSCTVESEMRRYAYVKTNADSVFVPNVFTPNGDGRNELFQVSTASDASVQLNVINRNGKEIFSGDGHKGWDGGDFVSGVYYWTVSFQDCKSNLGFQKGFVHLIR